MSCACKKTEKLAQKLSNQTNQEKESGFKRVLSSIWDSIINLLYRLVIGVMFLSLTPLIVILLFIYFIFSGDFSIRVPKFLIKTLKESHNT